ncbi:hypothetical protein, partial [Klebsiella pneumoniae]
TTTPPIPDLAELQHWTWVLGRAQQMMLEHGFDMIEHLPAAPPFGALLDPGAAMKAGMDLWSDTMQLWQRFLDPQNAAPFAETAEQA